MASVSQLSAPPTAAAGPSAPAWLYRPSIDLLFGYGLFYLISVPLLMAASLRFDPNGLPSWIAGSFLLGVTLPHYGATILRVYEQRHDRRKYAFFAVWVTAFVALWFVSSLYVQVLGSLLITLSVTWNPWHLSGQNYGLGVMYLRRVGVDVNPELKRPFYASFILSAALAAVWIHMPENQSFGTLQGHADASGTFHVLNVGFPKGITQAVAAGLSIAYVGCLLRVALQLRGRLAFSRQGPLWTLVAAQALWFSIPAFGVASGLYSLSTVGLPFLAFWIAAAHGAQYLWVTCYYQRKSEGGTVPVAFLTKALLAGGALVVPGLLFAPKLLGPVAPYSAGALALTFAMINLHHCILDGAIWKLRDGRIAQVLLRNASVAPEATGPPERRWLRTALLSLGGVVVILQAQLLVVSHWVNRPDTSLPFMRAVTAELAFLGLDGPELHAKLGAVLEENGLPGEAVAAYRKAVALNPQPAPWVANRLALLLVARPPLSEADAGEAMALASYLTRALGPTRSEGYETLAAVHLAAGRPDAAITAGSQALRISRRNEPPAKADALEARLRAHSILGTPSN